MLLRRTSMLMSVLQTILLLICKAALTTALPCYEPCLYYAKLSAIRRLPLQNSTGRALTGTPIQTVYSKGQHINAIAIDRYTGRMFWYDIITRMIYRANLNGSDSQVILRYGVGFCEGIAYDWSTDNIYWTDIWHKWIGVASSDGKNRKIIAIEATLQPAGIIVAPNEGFLFWTALGRNAKIERARLDGTERKAILTTGLYMPHDLQIDYSSRRLYWIDAILDKVASSDYDGKNRIVVTDVSYFGNILMHPYSMALFAQHSLVYFTDWYRSWVLHKSINGNLIYTLSRPIPKILQIGQVRILHNSTQPPVTSQCLQNKGNCSHLCIKHNATRYTCQCPTGTVLATYNSTQCQRAELDYQLFVVEGLGSNGKILHLSKFVGQPQYEFEGIKLPQSSFPVGLDFDQDKNMLYWTDVYLNKLFRMHVNGSGFQTLIDTGIETPETVQLDPATGLLYITDYNYEKIEVIKMDGSMRMDLITTDIVNPRDLVLYHEKGIMFYSDWHPSNPKIESMYMDGTSRKYIISSDISAPSGLAIDKVEQRIYWCDMQLDRIESSDLDGRNRRVLFDHYDYDPNIPLESVTGEIQLPYGLTLHQEKVFWTDWGTRAVYSADKRIGNTIDYITRVSQRPMQVHAYSKKKLKEYKKLYFFARAKKDLTSTQTHACFSKNCTGVFSSDPQKCPVGYNQTGFKEVCANCSAPFGVYNLRCECKNWMSCAHRAYSELSCPSASPFMQFKVRECTQVVNPGHCPNTNCPKVSQPNCTADGDCLDTQKCCNTSCGMKCLSSATSPGKHPCQTNNGGCSHFCFRIPNNFRCRCPGNMTLQPADNKTCILKSGLCAGKQPCLNGGICRDANTTAYNCSCKNGFFGRNCEKCPECPNIATCTKIGTGYKCNCTNDYVGQNCESINVCASNPCLNLGTCQVGEAGYTCKCVSGYKGKNCATIDYCASSNCRQSSLCVNGQTGYTCSCDTGYTGQYCDTLIDRCGGGDICKNKGVCTSTLQKAICTCDDYYGGETCEVYYGESVMEVTLNVTSSSNVTAEVIKSTIAKEYTNFCRTTDCAGSLKAKRKKRDTTSAVVLTSKDIMIPSGYPKMVTNSRAELQYAIIINAAGKSSALPEALLYRGFEAVKDGFSKSLNAAVAGYQIVKKPSNGKSTSKATSSSKGGLAAGLVVLALVLIFVIVIALYVLRKRRREKEAEIDFNRFDNVLYQSNTDLQDKKTPDVILNRRTNDGAVRDKKQQQFSNVVYDARQSYSEMENAELGASLDLPVSDNTVEVDMKEGMVGMVNPYMEAVESDRKSYPLAKTDSATISSSTNLKASVLASLDDESAMQFGSGSMLSGRSFNRDNERPMVVKVRSVGDDSVDGQSGFANPCAAVDDYIFSEDDTREAVDVAVHNSTENKQSPDESFPSRGDEPNRESSA